MYKMPELVNVQCSECGELDQVHWNNFGATEPCPVCNASPSDLFKVGE